MDAIEVVIQVDHGSRWLRLTDPVRVVDAWHPHAVHDALHQVERLPREFGYYAAGFVTYEAGAAFGLNVCTGDHVLPLVWFAFFEPPHVTQIEEPAAGGSYEIGDVTPSTDLSSFTRAVERIKADIANGHTHQVNYTFDLDGRFSGDPYSLFADLAAIQRGRYAAFIRTSTHAVASASRELFFARAGEELTARPVKGTAPRGRTVAEDEDRAHALGRSAKERAENAVIVDMMRNELGRIAQTASVVVPELFAVERYPTAWQMASRVTARSDARLPEIFAALHPSASVTGAPKIPAMRIIGELERRPRGLYTGAVGYVAPDGTAQFNVATRMALVDCASSTFTFGVGSGIVWDSDADAEYHESLLEAAVLGRRPRPFDLLETLRWAPESGFFLLDRHLDRLQQSARYFEYRCSPTEMRGALDRAVAGSDRVLRVRLLVARDGSPRVECVPLEPKTGPARIAVAGAPIDPDDVFLFHKTTNRIQYEQARSPRYDDVVLWNPQGQVTETTIANVVAEIGGRNVTPPVECGLLAGTFREQLLADGVVQVAAITIDQLRHASRLWLVNAVRGWWPATLVDDERDHANRSETATASTPMSASRTIPTTANRSQR